MNKIKKLYVYYHDTLVGTLAKTEKNKIAFQYDSEWIKKGFSISPFSLPLNDSVFIPKKDYFNGLFGIFADSLPDAWGNILLNRILKSHGINPNSIGPLERLAIIGNSGMGALSYRPEYHLQLEVTSIDLDQLAYECHQLLTTEYTDDLDTLFKLGGSSGGACPKILTQIEDKYWIIKFPAPIDSSNIGVIEYDYSLCAKDCGIHMTETKLFHSNNCTGYFGITRFDRIENRKVHMASAAALLEIDFRQPSLDYTELMKLTKILTKNNEKDILQMYKLACFNVFAHNRDDHAKNFSFIFDEKEDCWHLSPAYDLTYSSTYYGEHTTSVCGNAYNPSRKELIQLGINAGMKKNQCERIVDDIFKTTQQHLLKYLK